MAGYSNMKSKGYLVLKAQLEKTVNNTNRNENSFKH